MPALISRPNQSTPIDYDALTAEISQIFEQVQISPANHVKNFVSLHRLHSIFAIHTELAQKGKEKVIGERRFQTTVHSLLNKVFPFKKGEVSADRVVDFIGGYVKYINEKRFELVDEDDDDDTPESRFTALLLKFLLRGFQAKDKNVRYRVLQIVATMVSHLGEIDQDVYEGLRADLIARTFDKEANVRQQAILSLSRLCASDDPPEGEPSILDVLLEALATDPSAEVRRYALCNIPVTDDTLSAILERTRDTDLTNRKLVYSKILAVKIIEDEENQGSNPMGPAHPRALSISQRELIVRNGLGDREPSVRAAAGTLVSNWVDVVDVKAEETDVKFHERVNQNWETMLPSLLTLFDLGEGAIAEDALLSVFAARPEIFKEIELKDHYWNSITPEKAFLARVFVEHCKTKNDSVKLEANLPVVITIALCIQNTCNMLFEDLQTPLTDDVSNDERDRKEDEKITREVLISELLKFAVHLDYSDEVGRRKMLQLITQILRTVSLPEGLMAPCLDVLRTVYPKEQDLIKLVVEIVQDLRGAAYEDDEDDGLDENSNEADAETGSEPAVKLVRARQPLEEMTAERRAQVELVNLKCLNMCIEMLERVHTSFDQNSTLNGILDELIIPAVTKSKIPIFRERGLKALGLCSLIARDKAITMIDFLMKNISVTSGLIKATMLRCLFDIIMVHESFLFRHRENAVTLETISDFLLNQIRTEEDPKTRALLCLGTSKLVLSGMITTIEAIQTLIKTYLSPVTTGNQELHQCLSYFFPIYSCSSGENQKHMADIFIQVFLDVAEDRKQFDEVDDDMEMIGSAKVADMFLAWTDPHRLANAIDATGGTDANSVDFCIQLGMAESIIRVLLGNGLTIVIEKEDKKILCQLLNKLHIPDSVDEYKIRILKLLMDKLNTRRPLLDAICQNAFKKFENLISKKYEKELEGFSESEFRELKEHTELFDFLDSIIPLDDDELDIKPPRKGKKRRSGSQMSRSRSGSPPPQALRRSKRPRLSKPDDDDENIDGGSAPPAPPTRNNPKRAAPARNPPQVIVISSDSEGDVEDARASRAKAARSTGARLGPTVKTEETRVDRELLSGTSSLTLAEVSYDSIMDDPGSEEEDEEEVNDLLADSE